MTFLNYELTRGNNRQMTELNRLHMFKFIVSKIEMIELNAICSWVRKGVLYAVLLRSFTLDLKPWMSALMKPSL